MALSFGRMGEVKSNGTIFRITGFDACVHKSQQAGMPHMSVLPACLCLFSFPCTRFVLCLGELCLNGLYHVFHFLVYAVEVL